jgi:RimJ/RimL family protein N-acetyltransferase
VLPELAALDSMPVLAGERVTLRGITQDDAPQLHAVFSDPVAMRYWSGPPHTALAETEEMVARIHAGFTDRSVLQWGISRNADRRVLGTVTLFPSGRQPRAEIGYILGSEYWGKGYMQEALRALVRFAFDELKLRRIEADVDPRNAASVRSLDRLGFKREGLLRERWNVAGEIQDTAFFGLLAHEWRPTGA